MWLIYLLVDDDDDDEDHYVLNHNFEEGGKNKSSYAFWLEKNDAHKLINITFQG
jgi:hypothetical protein